MSYKISVEAAADLENSWLYTFDKWSLEHADRCVNLIFDEIEYLSTSPASGKDLSHIREKYRSSKVKSHIVFYRQVANHAIEIVRVLHQQMDIQHHLTD